MRRLLNIFRPVITVLLVFQVSVAYALPEGIHLNLCFSADGSIEISPDLCNDELSGLRTATEKFIPSVTSHSGCLEFELGCISAGDFRPSSSVKSPHKTRVRKNSSNTADSPIYLFASLRLLPITLAQNVISEPINLYSSLSSLRTIVLQI